ncbi:MAG: VTT domain-containing protein [Slackia sp.]|nr:VTT domain-containing protein [Slackia sp.]
MKRIEMKKHRIVALAAVLVVVGVIAAAALAYGPDLFAFFADGQRVQAWVDAQGAFAPVAMVALITFQIVVAVLPGEPLELGAGYAFGFWEGTALCLVAGLIGAIIVVALVRMLGMRVIELFFSREKIASMKWLQDSARFELVMFLCFLIPGTPKDIMTYIAGLTKCPLWRIVLIATVGRIPSIVSSTMAAGFAADGNWMATAVVVALTVVFVLAGVGMYAFIARRGKNRREGASRKAASASVVRCESEHRLAA